MNHWKEILVVILDSFIFLGAWAVDVSVTCLLLESNGIDTYITNGWWIRNPTQHYHIGLLMILISSILLAIIAIIPEKSKIAED